MKFEIVKDKVIIAPDISDVGVTSKNIIVALKLYPIQDESNKNWARLQIVGVTHSNVKYMQNVRYNIKRVGIDKLEITLRSCSESNLNNDLFGLGHKDTRLICIHCQTALVHIDFQSKEEMLFINSINDDWIESWPLEYIDLPEKDRSVVMGSVWIKKEDENEN